MKRPRDHCTRHGRRASYHLRRLLSSALCRPCGAAIEDLPLVTWARGATSGDINIPCTSCNMRMCAPPKAHCAHRPSTRRPALALPGGSCVDQWPTRRPLSHRFPRRPERPAYSRIPPAGAGQDLFVPTIGDLSRAVVFAEDPTARRGTPLSLVTWSWGPAGGGGRQESARRVRARRSSEAHQL